jgi:hypothetical protein
MLRHPIVFGRGLAEETSKIWIMDDDGSGLRQLTTGPSYDDHPSLYSDLRHVLYYTGQLDVLAEVPGCALHHASISPINDLLAYHRDCGKRLSEWVGWGPGSYEVNTIATNGVALPDGIIFMHEKNRGMPVRGVSIARMFGHGVGAKMIFLTDDQHLNRRPAVSPDGKQFAWQTDLASKEDEIFIANIDGSNPRNITNAPGNDGHPWYSRDGKTLVFESDRTGVWEIWKVDLQTMKFTQLTFGHKGLESTRPRM